MKKLYWTLLLLFVVGAAFAQNKPDDNLLYWSATRKLTVSDFQLKPGASQPRTSYAQFSMDYQLNGFDFMTRNFNKRVNHYLIKSASWIDSAANVAQSLRYWQTLFDLSEIYTRHFRKDLKDNRKKILSGTDFVEELNEKATTDFAKRRIAYDSETNFGTNEVMQQRWEAQVQKELEELKAFARE